MAKRRKQARASRGLPTPVWIGGLVGLVLIAIGLIALTARQRSNPTELNYPDITRVSPAEAYAGQQAGTAVIIDVRDEQSYQASHAAGALSIPEGQLPARLAELPTDRTLILY
jgi:hypothetical protein